ncbi:MAG: hypothetical protein ACNYNX_03380 [Leucobacter sp.]
MRYMLLLHGREEEVHAAPPERVEEITAFLARFEDELMSGSELDWTEVLASEVNALVVGPDGAARETWLNAEGLPLERVWVVRVADPDRAGAIAASLAAGVGAPVELRECLPSAQRP